MKPLLLTPSWTHMDLPNSFECKCLQLNCICVFVCICVCLYLLLLFTPSFPRTDLPNSFECGRLHLLFPTYPLTSPCLHTPAPTAQTTLHFEEEREGGGAYPNITLSIWLCHPTDRMSTAELQAASGGGKCTDILAQPLI